MFWKDGDTGGMMGTSGRLGTPLFPGSEHPNDPSVMSPRGGQGVLAGDRRKNWTHPSMSRVHHVPSLRQPSLAGPHRMRDGDTHW